MFERVLRASLLLIVFSAASLSADVIVTMESREGGAEPEIQTVKVKGERLKLTIEDGQSGPDEMIFAGDQDAMWLIDHDEKRVLVLDEETMTAMVEQISAAMEQMEAAMANVPEAQREMMENMMKQQMSAMGLGEDLPPREVKAAGSAEFGGRDCSLYKISRGDELQAEVCTVPFGSLEGGDEMMVAFGEMQEFYDALLEALARSPMLQQLQTSLQDSNPFGFGKEIDGVPVMTRRYDGGAVEGESLLVNMERQSLDAGEFELPSGYERQEIAPQQGNDKRRRR